MTDETYCYPPEYTVLKNKADIRDFDALQAFERQETANRMLDCPRNFPITYPGYNQLHHYIFQDVYEWAGKSRLVTIHKGDPFANWRYIDQEMEKRFKLIQQDTGLKRSSPQQFATYAAEHIAEINAIHPFREGNGRTQRMFLRNLAHQNGHVFDIERIDRDKWMQASIESFRHQNYEPMSECIRHALAGRNRSKLSGTRDRHKSPKDEGWER